MDHRELFLWIYEVHNGPAIIMTAFFLEMSLELDAWQKCMSARVMSNAQYFKMACKKNAISKLLTSFFINVSLITLKDQLLLLFLNFNFLRVLMSSLLNAKQIYIQDKYIYIKTRQTNFNVSLNSFQYDPPQLLQNLIEKWHFREW